MLFMATSSRAGYKLLSRQSNATKGPLPDDFIDARLTPRRLLTILKTAVSDRQRLKKMLALKDSISKPARSWR